MHQTNPSGKESNRCSEHQCDTDCGLDSGAQRFRRTAKSMFAFPMLLPMERVRP